MILFPKHLSVLDKEYTFGIARDIRFENRGGNVVRADRFPARLSISLSKKPDK